MDASTRPSEGEEAMAPFGYEEASAVLSEAAKAAILTRGKSHVDHMFREVTFEEERRIRSGSLTPEEFSDPNGFALLRYAAHVFAETTSRP